jgi:hypothetical protein
MWNVPGVCWIPILYQIRCCEHDLFSVPVLPTPTPTLSPTLSRTSKPTATPRASATPCPQGHRWYTKFPEQIQQCYPSASSTPDRAISTLATMVHSHAYIHQYQHQHQHQHQ